MRTSVTQIIHNGGQIFPVLGRTRPHLTLYSVARRLQCCASLFRAAPCWRAQPHRYGTQFTLARRTPHPFRQLHLVYAQYVIERSLMAPHVHVTMRVHRSHRSHSGCRDDQHNARLCRRHGLQREQMGVRAYTTDDCKHEWSSTSCGTMWTDDGWTERSVERS